MLKIIGDFVSSLCQSTRALYIDRAPRVKRQSAHASPMLSRWFWILAGTNCREAYHHQTSKSILFHDLAQIVYVFSVTYGWFLTGGPNAANLPHQSKEPSRTRL